MYVFKARKTHIQRGIKEVYLLDRRRKGRSKPRNKEDNRDKRAFLNKAKNHRTYKERIPRLEKNRVKNALNNRTRVQVALHK